MQKNPNKEKGKWWRRIRLTILLLVAVASVGFFGFVYKQLMTLPNVDGQYLNTFGTSEILDVNGKTIYKTTSQRVGKVSYGEIDDLLYTEALIAVEDENFYTSHGVSIWGILNIPVSMIRSKLDASYQARGGSTIDQQLIKNVYYKGRDVSTITRKVQEWWLAYQLNSNYSKEDILVYYLDNLEFAEGAKGISAIMMTYFGKTPNDYKERTTANIAEQAYLAGLGQAPSAYNLYENPDAAHKRTRVVLGVLLDKGIITQSEYNEAKDYDLTEGLQERFRESEEQRQKNLKYKVYTDEVIKQVESLGYNMDELTIKIHTFLNPETFDSITAMARQDQYYQDGIGGSEQIGVTVIDSNGIVVGMVGSRFEGDEYNRATQQTRSSGSSMKPFTAYGPLLQYYGNIYNTASTFDTSAYLYPGTNVYMHNYGQYTYGMQTIQYSLRQSLNTPVARIDDEILGSNRMKTFLHGLGLDVKDYYSSVDGIGINISTLQAAAAYNAVNNGGVYTEPRFVNKIEFTDGSVKEIPAKSHQAMNASVAYVLAQILRGVPQEGSTAAGAAVSGFVGYAGKTGSVAFDSNIITSSIYGAGGSDVWYDSITNGGYSVAIWSGYDEPNTSPQVSDDFKGVQWLGRDLQLMLNNGRSVTDWDIPSGVNRLSGSGLSAHYAVTDSSDIDVNSVIAYVTDIPEIYNSLGDLSVTPDTKANEDWEDDMTSSEKELYNMYKKDPSIANGTDWISDSLYKLFGG